MPKAKATASVTVGAHVKSAGGIFTAIERGVAIEAEAIQIFAAPPQTWRATNHTPDAIAKFRELHAESNIGEVWVHNIYLANLATETAEQLEKSVASVVNALTVAGKIGAQGVVLHTGSHKGLGIDSCIDQVAAALKRILDEAGNDCVLALETMAGQGGAIGTYFEEIGRLIGEVNSPRLQCCLDTCHVFAAGYDVTSTAALDATMKQFDEHIGLGRLAVVHANDSKMPLGGFRDRHANIGDGHIGTIGFETLLAHRALRGKTFLLEVPGLPTAKYPSGDGPDLENINRLKAIRDRV